MKNPHIVLLSVSLPETVFLSGLPAGAIEAIKAAYGSVVQILDPHRDSRFNLTLKLNLSKIPTDEGSTSSFSKSTYKHALLVKIAPVREVVLGAQLRVILKQHALRTFASDVDPLVALVHRPKESFFLIPQEELKSVERLQPASRCCKENRKKRRACCFWKWLCGMSCLCLSLIYCCCCCDGCSLT